MYTCTAPENINRALLLVCPVRYRPQPSSLSGVGPDALPSPRALRAEKKSPPHQNEEGVGGEELASELAVHMQQVAPV